MKQKNQISPFILLLFLTPGTILAQDSLTVKGQLSSWAMYNNTLDLPVYAGGRYIPQINYEVRFKEKYKLDFEASANINGMHGMLPFDTIYTNGQVKPYRIWARFSSNQFEMRAGLQKINFGSASILRPLMWFDQMDPRDPLNLTDGVWGILGRYYFLNNVNIWAWALYGNDEPKGRETIGTKNKYPELGGRMQLPFSIGEFALSYHHRLIDTRDNVYIPSFEKINENRIGFDIRFDLFVGAWLEGSLTNNNEDIGIYTNQQVFNAGLDYTFGIGNGLLVTYEQLLIAFDETAFEFKEPRSFSLLSLMYPIGLFDKLSTIVYYDWTNNNIYSFLNWQKTFNRFSMFLMAYWNPEDYKIPTQRTEVNLFAGKGVQIMFVFNH